MVTIQCLLPGRDFWGGLPVSELDATVLTGLERHASFEDVVDACRRSERLAVSEFPQQTVVALKVDDLPESSEGISLEDFEANNSAVWTIVPEEGYSIDYIEYQQCNGEAVVYPRLSGHECGPESIERELSLAIVDALSLKRASLDRGSWAVAYD